MMQMELVEMEMEVTEMKVVEMRRTGREMGRLGLGVRTCSKEFPSHVLWAVSFCRYAIWTSASPQRGTKDAAGRIFSPILTKQQQPHPRCLNAPLRCGFSFS